MRTSILLLATLVAVSTWSAMYPTTERTLESYGAIGDGVTDDTTALVAAFAAGVPLRGSANASYVVTSTVTIARTTTFDGNGCTFLLSSNGKFFGNQTVSTSTDSVTLSVQNTDLSGAGQTNAVSVLTCASEAIAADYVGGGYVRVISDDIAPWGADTEPGTKQGEVIRVLGQAGGTIIGASRASNVAYITNSAPNGVFVGATVTVSCPEFPDLDGAQTVTGIGLNSFTFASVGDDLVGGAATGSVTSAYVTCVGKLRHSEYLLTNVRAKLYDTSKLVLDNFNIVHSGNSPLGVLVLYANNSPVIRNINIVHNGNGISLYGTVNATVENIRQDTVGVYDGLQQAVVGDTCCYGSTIRNIRGGSMRHLVTTGTAVVAAGASTWYLFGRSEFGTVSDVVLDGTGASLAIHGDANYWTLRNVYVAMAPAVGGASSEGFTIRGSNILLDSCTVAGNGYGTAFATSSDRTPDNTIVRFVNCAADNVAQVFNFASKHQIFIDGGRFESRPTLGAFISVLAGCDIRSHDMAVEFTPAGSEWFPIQFDTSDWVRWSDKDSTYRYAYNSAMASNSGLVTLYQGYATFDVDSILDLPEASQKVVYYPLYFGARSAVYELDGRIRFRTIGAHNYCGVNASSSRFPVDGEWNLVVESQDGSYRKFTRATATANTWGINGSARVANVHGLVELAALNPVNWDYAITRSTNYTGLPDGNGAVWYPIGVTNINPRLLTTPSGYGTVSYGWTNAIRSTGAGSGKCGFEYVGAATAGQQYSLTFDARSNVSTNSFITASANWSAVTWSTSTNLGTAWATYTLDVTAATTNAIRMGTTGNPAAGDWVEFRDFVLKYTTQTPSTNQFGPIASSYTPGAVWVRQAVW